MPDPLSSPGAYQKFIYTLPGRCPSIQRSTLVYIPTGDVFGRVEGMLVFEGNIILCAQEYLNFGLGIIEGYGYEVSRAHAAFENHDIPSATEYCLAGYPHKDKLYWYDSFPHSKDPDLASTHPHHKHIPPDIKHHRIPAPDLSFTHPNLLFLVEEIERQARANPSEED